MTTANANSRLETFCDGVFAIALTLLIIEIKVPHTAKIMSPGELWITLQHLLPSFFAFVLSFIIILITWANHHNSFKLITASSSSFIYANGFLLLTVVFLPFPTALMGEYLLTEQAAPAVILYNATLTMQAGGWILITGAAMKDNLCKNEKALLTIRKNGMFGYIAFILYSVCALLAFWFPVAITIITTLIWILWLIRSITIKQE